MESKETIFPTALFDELILITESITKEGSVERLDVSRGLTICRSRGHGRGPDTGRGGGRGAGTGGGGGRGAGAGGGGGGGAAAGESVDAVAVAESLINCRALLLR
eukprot:scaffold5222_cov63-Phaeocystis_antarctica.AAC.2